MDSDLYVPAHGFQAQGVVHIPRVFAVDGQGVKKGQIPVLRMERNIPGSRRQDLSHLVQNVSPEGLRDPVAEQKQIFVFAPFAQPH